MFLPVAMFSQYFFGPVLFLLSVFIILIILLQRGRGGGLTGALGGAGGTSAFGVKAGDIFTRITAVSVLIWIVICATACFWYLPIKLDIDAEPGAISSGLESGTGTGMLVPPLTSDNFPAASPNASDTPGTSDPVLPTTNVPTPTEAAPTEAAPTEASPTGP